MRRRRGEGEVAAAIDWCPLPMTGEYSYLQL